MADGCKIHLSRVVKVSDGRASIGRKWSERRDISTDSLNRAGLTVPKCRRYRVTYRVDARGPIRVVSRGGAYGLIYSGLVVRPLSGRKAVYVCLIEARWPGTRYRRTVEVLER